VIRNRPHEEREKKETQYENHHFNLTDDSRSSSGADGSTGCRTRDSLGRPGSEICNSPRSEQDGGKEARQAGYAIQHSRSQACRTW
jgi:hypothetical protein